MLRSPGRRGRHPRLLALWHRAVTHIGRHDTMEIVATVSAAGSALAQVGQTVAVYGVPPGAAAGPRR